MLFPKPLTACAMSAARMDLFTIDDWGRLWTTTWRNGPWDVGTTLPQTPQGSLVLGGGVASNSRNDHQMDVFSVDSLGRLWTMWWLGDSTGAGDWHGPLLLSNPGSLPPGCAVASNARTENQMDVFAVDAQGRLWTMWWNGNWNGPITLSDPGQLIPGSGLATNARNANQMDVFAVDPQGRLWTMWWNGTWQAPSTLSPPGSLISGGGLASNKEVASSPDVNLMYVYATSPQDQQWFLGWAGGWNASVGPGVPPNPSPPPRPGSGMAATSRTIPHPSAHQPDQVWIALDVFVFDSAGRIANMRWDPSVSVPVRINGWIMEPAIEGPARRL